MSSGTCDLLFFGDMVGKAGRTAVTRYLSGLDSRPDIVVANAENTTHGFGLSPRHYQEMLGAGIHVLTSGNHIFDRAELLAFMPQATALLRPDNIPADVPGTGARVFDIETPAGPLKLAVLNLIGQVFMGNYNSPWERLDYWLPRLKAETPLIFLDFHAEATAEKNAFARYAAELGVSAMVGTHTHVQTADERILMARMGYITDAGFNGAYDSVIGMDPAGSTLRLKSLLPARLEVADGGDLQVNAIRFTLDRATGACVGLTRIRELLPARADIAVEV